MYQNSDSGIEPLVTPLQPELGNKQVSLPKAYGSVLSTRQDDAPGLNVEVPDGGVVHPLPDTFRLTSGVRTTGKELKYFF